jgi:hypothetical protein
MPDQSYSAEAVAVPEKNSHDQKHQMSPDWKRRLLTRKKMMSSQ